jgi:hypothetical protein
LTHSLFCCGNQTPEDIVVITAIIAATLASTLVLLFPTTLQVAGLIYTSTGERKVPIYTSGDNNVYITWWWSNKTGNNEVMFKLLQIQERPLEIR